MIEVSIKCPCGTHAMVTLTGGDAAHRWSCNCPQCYDPESGGLRKHCLGYGETHEDAIAEWWETVEVAWEIDYEPVTLVAELAEQVGDEADAQSLWVFSNESNDGAPRWFAPHGVELPPIPTAWPREET